MAIKIEWAKYLVESTNYQQIVTDEKYLSSWREYLEKKENELPMNELVVIPNKLVINDQSMVLDYVLINRTDSPIKDVEMNVTLSLLEKDYFTGFLRTTKDAYDELSVNHGRLDLIDFGNDRYENQEAFNMKSPSPYDDYFDLLKENQVTDLSFEIEELAINGVKVDTIN
ncbi:hypothetical protein [uncultured Vagococcus sp.]|uniref:hypothetical protein n=1 Tax=uncultured Vagococcus sp. TaxID=189676 RepID=UPI0028D180C1|nr:hypothetical protein [uncultured Vagococcus sp.]